MHIYGYFLINCLAYIIISIFPVIMKKERKKGRKITENTMNQLKQKRKMYARLFVKHIMLLSLISQFNVI